MSVVRVGFVGVVVIMMWGCGGTSTAPEPDPRLQELVGSYAMSEFRGEALPTVLDTIARHGGLLLCWTTLTSGTLHLDAAAEYVWHRHMRTDCEDGSELPRGEHPEVGSFSFSHEEIHFTYPTPWGSESIRPAVLAYGKVKFLAPADPDLEFHMIFERIDEAQSTSHHGR